MPTRGAICEHLRALVAALQAAGVTPGVTYVEYDGSAMGADATFTCTAHDVVLVGPHPSHPAPDT